MCDTNTNGWLPQKSAERKPLAHGAPREYHQGRPLVTYTVRYNGGQQGKGQAQSDARYANQGIKHFHRGKRYKFHLFSVKRG